MKYQSEIIKEIIASKGHSKSLPHYESECIETWIEEAKGAYPKLTDYKGEWLAYINDNSGIGEFPYVSLTDVTEATIDNVVPYAYKRAILKGQTLVNLVSSYAFGGRPILYESRFYDQPVQGEETITVFVVNSNISTIKVGLFYATTDSWATEEIFDVSINKKVVYTVPSGFVSKYVGVVVTNENDSTGFENGLVIVRGDQSQLEVNTYFEGMQSVEMPVLMTYANLFTGFVAFGYIDHGGNLVESNGNIASDFIEINAKTIAFRTFRENGEPSPRHGEFAFYDNNKNFISRKINSDTTDEYTTVPDGTKYVRVWSVPLDGLGLNTKGMLVYTKDKPSLAITEYLASNKSNILTVNEEVELRGIGEIQDTLDCLTAEVVERIGEVVLDDTLSYERAWNGSRDTETDYIIAVRVNNHLWNVHNEESGSLIKCDKLRTRGITSFNGYGYFLFYVSKSVLGEELTNAKIREYILSLNATVQYPLATESIKTVELSCVNEQGENETFRPIEGTMHLMTEGDTIKPLFSGEIPVEASTQNLMSFVNIEEEEK